MWKAIRTAALLILVAAAGASSTALAQGKVTLRFPSWQWGQPGYEQFFDEAIKAFEAQHPNVTIEKITIPSASYTDQLVKMFASGDPPEIVQFPYYTFNRLAAAGWLEPLDTLVASAGLKQEWAPYLWDGGLQNGKLDGLYISGAARLLYYNKAMFKAAGLSVPKTPDEFVADAKQLTLHNADGTVKQYGFSIANKPDVNFAAYGLNILVTAIGGNWAKDGKPNAESDAVKQAINLERQLIKAGTVPIGADRIGARQVFWEGKAAMLIEGPWVMTSIEKENPGLLKDVGVALLPFPNQVAALSNGFAIARDQKHKDLAWDFIKLISSNEWMQKYVVLTGVTSGLVTPPSQQVLAKYPWMTTFIAAAKVGKDPLPSGMETYTTSINQIIANDVSNVFFGNETIDHATAAVQSDMAKLTK